MSTRSGKTLDHYEQLAMHLIAKLNGSACEHYRKRGELPAEIDTECTVTTPAGPFRLYARPVREASE